MKFQRSPAKIERRLTKKIPLQLTEYYDDELLTDLYSYRGIRRHKKADREKVFEDVFRISVAADTYREGHCYLVPIPFGLDPERYALYENGRRLVRGTASHDDIRKFGDGRYSIWATPSISPPKGIPIRFTPATSTSFVRSHSLCRV